MHDGGLSSSRLAHNADFIIFVDFEVKIFEDNGLSFGVFEIDIFELDGAFDLLLADSALLEGHLRLVFCFNDVEKNCAWSSSFCYVGHVLSVLADGGGCVDDGKESDEDVVAILSDYAFGVHEACE